jgi:hypothetical protein
VARVVVVVVDWLERESSLSLSSQDRVSIKELYTEEREESIEDERVEFVRTAQVRHRH